jgi:acyl-CoA thioester hydrolase
MVEGYSFHTSFRVRYSEIDPQMIVFNVHYLNYIVISNTEYFRTTGIRFFDKEEVPFDIALVKSTLEFKSPAYFDDVIDAYVRISRLGRKSYTANYIMIRASNGEVIFKAENIYVGFNPATKQSELIPEHIRKIVRAFEGQNLMEDEQ